MRRLLGLTLSLVVLLMLAQLEQPRPARAQGTERYWAMPVDGWTFTTPALTHPGSYTGDLWGGVTVPDNNIFTGFISLRQNISGSGGDLIANVHADSSVGEITAGGQGVFGAPANGNGPLGFRCLINIFNSTARTNACNSLAANLGLSFNANNYFEWNELTEGQEVTLKITVATNAGIPSNNKVTTVGVSHLIFYGIPPINACFVPEPGEGVAPLIVTFTDCSTPEEDIETWDWYIDDVFYSDEQEPEPYEFTEPGVYLVTLVVNEGETNEDSVTIPIQVYPPENLVRPFRATDEGVPLGGIDAPAEPLWLSLNFAEIQTLGTGLENTVTGFSKSHAVVHAAKEGVVTSIKRLQYGDCDTSSETCYVIFGDNISGAFGEFFNGYVFEYLLNDVYVVTLETAPGNFLTYMVTNPYQYANIGDTVGKGCPLGESIPLVSRPSSALGDVFNFVWQGIAIIFGKSIDDVKTTLGNVAGFQPAPSTEFTILTDNAIIGGTHYVVPIIDQLLEYPEDEPRICDYQPSACLSADPELKRPELWTTTGAVEWFSGGGAVLNPGSSINMQLALDSEEDYTVEVWARSVVVGSGVGEVVSGQIGIQLGQTFTTVNPYPQFRQFIIPSGSHVPDLGLFYTLSVSNTGSRPVIVQSVCVRDENNGSSRPPVCYFTNPSFDGLPATQGWDVTGTVNGGAITGEIIMYDGDTISQNAQLYPDGISAHVYFVTVTATVGGADIATLKADTTSEVGFEYEYPVGTGFEPYFGPNSADTIAVSGFFTGVDNGITFLPDNQIVFWANLTVSSFENSDFTIRAVIESENPNLFLRVREVCIDDPFDHHDDPDAWIPEPPFEPNCVGISPPQGNDIGPWIFYHWSQLDRFFQCDLIILLNRMHDTAQNAYKLMGWQFRYWQSVALMFTRWLSSDLIHWLNGHFRNMAVGQVTTIESAPGATLWDVLLALINGALNPIIEMIGEIISTLLGIVTQAVNLLFTLITAIISLVLAIIVQLLNLFGLAQQLLGSLITAYNTATPTPLPGMANCTTDPQANSWCKSMWVLSNTIFSGPGALIIPLLTAVMSIHLILFVIGELKRMVISVGQSS